MKIRIGIAVCRLYVGVVKAASVCLFIAAGLFLLGAVGLIETGGVPTPVTIFTMIFGPSTAVLLLGYSRHLDGKLALLEKEYDKYSYRKNKKYRIFCYKRDGIIK